MRKIKPTLENIKKINPENILYAEFAVGGAMGDCGSVRIYELVDQTLRHYYANFYQDKDIGPVYDVMGKLLHTATQKNQLTHEYAGYGNHAYKNPKYTFFRNDDNYSFIYEKDGKKYIMPASNPGVYGSIVGKFATRKISLETLKAYHEEVQFKISESEDLFFACYIEESHKKDEGKFHLETTPENYMEAIAYIRHYKSENYILNTDEEISAQHTLQKYRLKYIVDKIGWDKTNNIFQKLAEKKSVKIFTEFDKALGEKVDDLFMDLKTIKSNCSRMDYLHTDSIDALFKYPVLVDFTPSAHQKIIKKITEGSNGWFQTDAIVVAYYFANYILNENKLSYANVLPAAWHVISKTPFNDFNHTRTDQLFWLAGEIIDSAWRCLEEDEEIDVKYRDLIWQNYWPRVGGVWPIIHRSEFNFNSEAGGRMFDEAMGFVLSLEDLPERNIELKHLFQEYGDKADYRSGELDRRAFWYFLSKMSAKERFEYILKNVQPEYYSYFLRYPKTIEEAELLLNELFKDDNKAKITNGARLDTIEQLLLSPNTIGVGEYILNYINDNWENFVKVIKKNCTNFPESLSEILTDLFIAISKGITEENEFPAFNEIAKKVIEAGGGKTKVKNATKYARKHRRMILFQRSDLQKIFNKEEL